MYTQENVIEMLDTVFKMKLQNKSLNFKDEFIVAPQVENGISTWAEWLRKGYFEPYHICWAFKDSNPKEWLALRIYIPMSEFSFSKQKEKKIGDKATMYFNLRNSKDRSILKQLEDELHQFFKELEVTEEKNV